MKKIILIIMMLCLFSAVLSAYTITAEKGMEKYKDKVESEIGPTVKDVTETRQAAHELFKNEKVLAEELSYLLGCEDKINLIFQDIHYNLYDSHTILATLEKIKIISYEEVKKQPSLETGYLSYEFPDEKTVNLVFSSMTGDAEEDNFYLPVLIDKDGNIVKKAELLDGLVSVGGNTNLKGAMLLYENVEESIVNIDRIDFPFSRWFNEGMNYKITSLLLHKVNCPAADDFDKLFATSKESEALKDKVNLWDFAQFNLVSKDDYSRELESANIQASCRLADELYEKIGREGFYKMNTELKYSEFLSNEQICKIVKDLLDTDLKAMLEKYIPEACVKLIESKGTENLLKDAKALMDEKKYKEVIPVLLSVLTADPYNHNARLNLARCYREEKNILDSDKHIFIAANAMIPGAASISIWGEENEQIYVIIGKYLFMSEAIDDAYKFLSVAYETDKSDDIKQILDSIDYTRENMKKELYGGE